MFCRNCGKELTGAPEFCMNCGAKPMAGTSFCPGCGAPTTPLTEICTKCGARVAKAIKGKTWKPTAAGILCIIAGAIGVITGIVVATVGSIWGAFLFFFFGVGWLGAIGAPLIILGIIAIVGGIYALKRRIWGLALAGSICAIIGGILGILAIIFVSLGKGEFE
jgi:hypothetical protein